MAETHSTDPTPPALSPGPDGASAADVPRWVGGMTLVLCAALMLTAGVGVFAAWSLPNSPGWAMIGFEIVLLLGGAVGVLFGLGKFREAPGLSLACVTGVGFVGSVLGYLGVGGALGTFSLREPLFARLAAAGMLGLLATIVPLRADLKSWRMLVIGGVLGSAGVGAVGGAVAAYSRGLPPFVKLAGPAEVARVTGLMIAALLAVVLMSVGMHLVIQAFERRRREPQPPLPDAA